MPFLKPGKQTGIVTGRQVLGLFLMALAAATVVYVLFFLDEDKVGDASKQARPVTSATVREKNVDIWINAIGTLVPRNLVVIRTRIEGELIKLPVAEGDLVKEGQLLAKIDPRAAEVQLMQANGQLGRDKALLKNAELDLERYRTLLEKDAVSRQQVDTQAALVQQYKGTVEVDKGAVVNAELQLSYTQIKAPMDGRVGLRQVDPGNTVKPGDVNGIMVLAQVQPILAVFSVPETQLPAITEALADEEDARVEIWDREQKNRLAKGKLLTADNQIDTTTGTLKLKAQFANEDNELFPNQFVNVRLAVGRLKNAKVVPSSAVLRGAGGTYVYLITEDKKAKAVPVKLGPLNGEQQVIEGDIAAGALVVSDGADKLREGAAVEIISEDVRAKAVAEEVKPKKKKKKGGEAEDKAPGAETTPAAPAAGAVKGAEKSTSKKADTAAEKAPDPASGKASAQEADSKPAVSEDKPKKKKKHSEDKGVDKAPAPTPKVDASPSSSSLTLTRTLLRTPTP